MNEFIFILTYFSFIFVFVVLLFALTGRKHIEVKCIFLWQFFWLSISVINPFDLLSPPREAAFYILICNLCLLIGYVLKNRVDCARMGYYIELQDFLYKKKFFFIALIFSISLFFSIKAILVILSSEIVTYRRDVFKNPEIVFGFHESLPIFQLLIMGGVLLSVLFSLHKYFCYGRKIGVIISLIMTSMISLIFLGRTELYQFFIMFILAFFIYKSDSLSKYFFKILFCSLASLSFFFVFSIFRNDGEMNVFDVITKHVIGYHSFGYNLFNIHIKSHIVDLDTSWFGLATLGSIGYFMSKPLLMIVGGETYLQSDLFLNQDAFVNLGVYKTGSVDVDFYENAFYTLYVEIYNDFSWFGPLIFVFFGYFISFLIGERHKGNPYAAMLSILIVYFFIVSGMKNPLTAHTITLPIIYLLSCVFIYRERVKTSCA